MIVWSVCVYVSVHNVILILCLINLFIPLLFFFF